jgi:soluble lytic murein transglycosylase-like protein
MNRARLIAGFFSATLCFITADARADDAGIDRWHDLVAAASHVFDIPESWISSVMRAESDGQETLGGKPITSTAGAMGLMQIMPETWAELRSRYRLGDNPYDPHDNVFAGAAYLRELYQRYGYPNLFAAYNAGPGRLDSFLERGGNLPYETWFYLSKLGVQSHMPHPASRQLFFALSHDALEQTSLEAGRLFIPLRAAPHSP